jgi:hypothetical protein
MMNREPLTTFSDGSQLVLSTHYIGEETFRCELYLLVQCMVDVNNLQPVPAYIEGTSCLQAQEKAYHHAMNMFPERASTMKKPPYLIWQGPVLRAEPVRRWGT